MVNEPDLIALCHALGLCVHFESGYGLGYFSGVNRLVLKRLLAAYRPATLYEFAKLLVVKPTDQIVRDLNLPSDASPDVASAVSEIAQAMSKLRPDLIEE